MKQPDTNVLIYAVNKTARLHWVTIGNRGVEGNITTDAHLAAIAIEHGATLASFDSNFDRFEGLRFERLRA